MRKKRKACKSISMLLCAGLHGELECARPGHSEQHVHPKVLEFLNMYKKDGLFEGAGASAVQKTPVTLAALPEIHRNQCRRYMVSIE